MGYPSDLTDAQWKLVEPLLLADADHRRGPKVRDSRKRFDALLYMTHTGCQWRFLPDDFGTWGSVWGSFNRWSKAGVFGPVLLGLHGQARQALHRAEARPSLVVIDSQLARGAANGGGSCHGQGGPWVRLRAPSKLSRTFGIEFERYGWAAHPKPFKPIARAWQVEAAHGMLGRSRRLSKSFEQTETSANAWLELACIHVVVSDKVWTNRPSRRRTPAEQAAMGARKNAERYQPVPGDLGIYDPTSPTDDTVLADETVRVSW